MNVALIQMRIEDETRSGNPRRALERVVSAAENDPPADLIGLGGRVDGLWRPDPVEALSLAMVDAFPEVLSAKAREVGTHVVAGVTETDGERLYDSAVWLDADGDLLTRHRRIMLSEVERRWLTPGTDLRVHKMPWGTAGLLVGDDVCSSWLVGSLRQMGASWIVSVCAWKNGRRRGESLSAIAREHGVWLVVVNSLIAGGDGQTRIINPTGRVVVELGNEEGILNGRIESERTSR